MPTPPEHPVKVAVYAFEGVSMFHLSVPLLTFDEVGRRGLAHWETRVFSDGVTSVRAAEGLDIAGVRGPESARDADIVVIPSWHADARKPSEVVVAIIRAAHARGALVLGLCLGSLVVAESGILDGRAATTHWGAFDLMETHYPAVRLDKKSLYVDLQDVLTSAGTAAALDACLHVVRERLGAEAANSVARGLVIAPHRDGGQAQYTERPIEPTTTHQPISELLAWMTEHLDEDLSVDRLAGVAHMSRRTFLRTFRAATGATPAAWVNARRLDQARRALEITDNSIEWIARDCGFGSTVTFRQRFAAAFQTTPSDYRRRFRVA